MAKIMTAHEVKVVDACRRSLPVIDDMLTEQDCLNIWASALEACGPCPTAMALAITEGVKKAFTEKIQLFEG